MGHRPMGRDSGRLWQKMNTRNLRFRSNRVADICALYHADLDPLYGRG